jgi:hypothetical protein
VGTLTQPHSAAAETFKVNSGIYHETNNSRKAYFISLKKDCWFGPKALLPTLSLKMLRNDIHVPFCNETCAQNFLVITNLPILIPGRVCRCLVLFSGVKLELVSISFLFAESTYLLLQLLFI